MVIRRINRKDHDEFIKMSVEFYNSDAVIKSVPNEYHEKAFTDILTDNTYVDCFIFDCDSEIAGYGLLNKSYSREAGGLVLWIEALYVKKQFRGKGFGSEFISFVENNFDFKRLRLEVEKENYRAVKMYERNGLSFLEYDQMIKDL